MADSIDEHYASECHQKAGSVTPETDARRHSVPGACPIAEISPAPTVSASVPSLAPGLAGDSTAGSEPGYLSEPEPGSAPRSVHVSVPGTPFGPAPRSTEGSAHASAPGSHPVSHPGSGPGSGPASGAVTRSGSVTQPGTPVSCDLQKEGYSVITAGVFLTSTSVGANLLNVPQGMGHIGWLGLPVLAVLGFQSWFCSHLLASSWMLVQTLDPTLSGVVHQPYPVMAERALGPWARHLISLAVLGVDTLSSVMLLVLASDLVASIVSYTFPPAQPTVCLLILLMATFLCPFTWFESPKNFWMVAVLGLSTSLSAWVLLLMKMCADFCSRPAPPVRAAPSPLRMLVGMSGVTNCFTTAGVQPTIQADMRDRSAFTAALAAVFLVVSLMVSSTAATSYTLLGSEARSSVLHNLGPGRLLLAIQSLMLLHVLTSFIIYINPLYQELEDVLDIPEGSWRQYTFRTLCMCLLVLVSEALPDFSNVLDLLSVLAIIITMVVPPIMYLRLTSHPDIDVQLSRPMQAFLILLAAAGVVYSVASAFGATSFVFVEQQQGSCFRSRGEVTVRTVRPPHNTTPANRAIIFKAQILTPKPAAAVT